MAFEARHNGILVARHEDQDHLKRVLSHLEEGLEISEGRSFELHAVGNGADAIIDSFHSLDEAKAKCDFYTNPIVENGVEIRGARFPKAEVRNAGGTVVYAPGAKSEAPEAPAPAPSEAPTDPAPAA